MFCSVRFPLLSACVILLVAASTTSSPVSSSAKPAISPSETAPRSPELTVPTAGPSVMDGTCTLLANVRCVATQQHEPTRRRDDSEDYAYVSCSAVHSFLDTATPTAPCTAKVTKLELYAVEGFVTLDKLLGSPAPNPINTPDAGISQRLSARIPLVDASATQCTVALVYHYNNGTDKQRVFWGTFDKVYRAPLARYLGNVIERINGTGQFTHVVCSGSFSASQHMSLYNVSFDYAPAFNSATVSAAPGSHSDPADPAWVLLPTSATGSGSNPEHWEQFGIQGRFDGSSTYSLLISLNYNGGVATVVGQFTNITDDQVNYVPLDG